jgi:hypothetical protein
MTGPERLVEAESEIQVTREDVRDVFTARVIRVEGDTIWVVSEWLDGGANAYGPLITKGEFAVSDEVTIARDQYDSWIVLTVGALTSSANRTFNFFT